MNPRVTCCFLSRWWYLSSPHRRSYQEEVSGWACGSPAHFSSRGWTFSYCNVFITTCLDSLIMMLMFSWLGLVMWAKDKGQSVFSLPLPGFGCRPRGTWIYHSHRYQKKKSPFLGYFVETPEDGSGSSYVRWHMTMAFSLHFLMQVKCCCYFMYLEAIHGKSSVWEDGHPESIVTPLVSGTLNVAFSSKSPVLLLTQVFVP